MDDDPFLDNERDDLEYDVTFPSPKQRSASSFVIEPVVFLLGWSGCVNERLAEYSERYNDAGCITIRYTAPEPSTFSNTIPTVSKKLLDLTEDLALETNPIFIHSFSTLGCLVYQCMISALLEDPKYEELKKRIRGRIFDSVAPERHRTYYSALVSILFGFDSIFSTIVTFFILIYSYCLRWIRRPSYRSFFDDERRFDSIPCLFFYSRIDSNFPPTDVETVVRNKIRNGCPVTRICYESSPHVGHFDFYTENYISSMIDFVCKSVKEQ